MPSNLSSSLSGEEEEERRRAAQRQLSPEEARAKQQREREEKQRRYDEARAKIFGTPLPTGAANPAAAASSSTSTATRTRRGRTRRSTSCPTTRRPSLLEASMGALSARGSLGTALREGAYGTST